jgi:hypothetical protein
MERIKSWLKNIIRRYFISMVITLRKVISRIDKDSNKRIYEKTEAETIK